jgi:hypothetical protein
MEFGFMLESPKVSSYVDLFSDEEFAVLHKVRLPYASAVEVRYARSFLMRYRLNSGIVKNRYWTLPVVNPRFEEVQVGRSSVPTSDFCARFVSDSYCDNVEGHKGVVLDGVDCSDKVIVRHRHLWCHRATCCLCFYNGWSSRLARSAAGKIEEGVRRGYGVPEHFTISVSKEDADLSLDVLRKRCAAVAFDRGIFGFLLIPHAVRIDRVGKKLVRRVHFHGVGFISGGFSCCRNCSHERGDCALCSAFKGREVRGYKNDHYLVKVHEARKTVEGTIKYLLGHATLKVGMRRSAVVTYHGLLACCKLKSFPLPVKNDCPACTKPMVRGVHVGRTPVVRDVGNPLYRSVEVLPLLDECGCRNYVDVEEVGRNG